MNRQQYRAASHAQRLHRRNVVTASLHDDMDGALRRLTPPTGPSLPRCPVSEVGRLLAAQSRRRWNLTESLRRRPSAEVQAKLDDLHARFTGWQMRAAEQAVIAGNPVDMAAWVCSLSEVAVAA